MSRERKPSEWHNVKRRLTASFRQGTLGRIAPEQFLASPAGISPWDLASGHISSRGSDFKLIDQMGPRYRGSQYGFARNEKVTVSRVGGIVLRSPVLMAGTVLFIGIDLILAAVVLYLL